MGPHFTDRGYNAFMLQAVSNFYMRHVRACVLVPDEKAQRSAAQYSLWCMPA